MMGTKPVVGVDSIRKRRSAIRNTWTREESQRRKAIASDRQRRLLCLVFGPDNLAFKTPH